MTAHNPSKHEVETYSGRFVDTSNPSAESIALEDIAHALANTCRFGGHCGRFYSVAEHAIFVSKRIEAQLGAGALWLPLAGLHHDDSEAYLGDIPRPMKGLLGDAYARMTIAMDAAICEGLDLTWPGDGRGAVNVFPGDFHMQSVKDADNYALFVEAQHLLPSKGINWTGSFSEWDLDAAVAQEAQASTTPDYWTGGLSPIIAEGLFLARHHELTQEVTA